MTYGRSSRLNEVRSPGSIMRTPGAQLQRCALCNLRGQTPDGRKWREHRTLIVSRQGYRSIPPLPHTLKMFRIPPSPHLIGRLPQLRDDLMACVCVFSCLSQPLAGTSVTSWPGALLRAEAETNTF